MGKEILITGYPGFISGRLVQKLWEKGDDFFHFLVHPQMVEVAKKWLEEKDPKGKRSRIWVGDLKKPHLGMSWPDWRDITKHMEVIYHLAALYHLGTPFWPAYQVNVLGTRQILHLAERSKKTPILHYFSTAYVAGRRKGVVLESELDKGQKFRNHYESTKFLAEVVVQEKREEIPTVIYRPAIVVGDSKTGETAKIDGPYYAIQLLHRLKQKGKLYLAPYLLPQIGDGLSDLNIVPVDFVVECVFHLSQDENALGKTFHLVDPHPISVGEFRKKVFEHYGVKDFPLSLPGESLFLFQFTPSPLWRWIGVPRQILDYLHNTPRFDTRQVQPFLKKHNLRCPSVVDYLPKMIEFVENQHRLPFASTPLGLKAS